MCAYRDRALRSSRRRLLSKLFRCRVAFRVPCPFAGEKGGNLGVNRKARVICCSPFLGHFLTKHVPSDSIPVSLMLFQDDAQTPYLQVQLVVIPPVANTSNKIEFLSQVSH